MTTDDPTGGVIGRLKDGMRSAIGQVAADGSTAGAIATWAERAIDETFAEVRQQLAAERRARVVDAAAHQDEQIEYASVRKELAEQLTACQAERDVLADGMKAANKMFAVIRDKLWRSPVRFEPSESRTLTSMVATLVRKLEEAQDNRAGEADQRYKVEATRDAQAAQIATLQEALANAVEYWDSIGFTEDCEPACRCVGCMARAALAAVPIVTQEPK